MICPSKDPIFVRIGFVVLKVKYGNVPAVLLIKSELRIPGPHHMFSVDRPIERAL